MTRKVMTMMALAALFCGSSAFAPKALVIVAGKEDPIFLITATRRAFKELQRIYDACGAKDRCHLVIGDEGHRCYADEAWPVMLKEIENIQRKKASSRRPKGRA